MGYGSGRSSRHDIVSGTRHADFAGDKSADLPGPIHPHCNRWRVCLAGSPYVHRVLDGVYRCCSSGHALGGGYECLSQQLWAFRGQFDAYPDPEGSGTVDRGSWNSELIRDDVRVEADATHDIGPLGFQRINPRLLPQLSFNHRPLCSAELLRPEVDSAMAAAGLLQSLQHQLNRFRLNTSLGQPLV